MGSESDPIAADKPAVSDGATWAERLVGALPDLWFRLTVGGRFLAVGGPPEDLYVPSDVFLGRLLEDVLPPAVAASLRGACAASLAGAPGRVEYELEIAGRSRHFVAVIADAGEGEVAMFVRDVTARVDAERRVADSERRFRAVVDVANEGIWMVDADGLTSFVTEQMARMLGYQPEEMLDQSPIVFVDEAFQDLFTARIARRREGVTEAGRVDFRGRDGSVVPATVAAAPIHDDAGRYLGAVASVTDERLTARRERELAESQRRLGAIAEVHDEVFYVGEILPDGSYCELFTGPGADRLLGGVPPRDVEHGEFWSQSVHPDHAEMFAAMNRTIATGQPASAEYLVVGVDGVARWMHDRTRPRPVDDDGRRIFDGVVSDVTERREQADQLARTLAELHSTYAELERAHRELEQAHREADRLARTDALTGIDNRRQFSDAIGREFARDDRESRGVGVVLLDVDHFKRVNDTHGHDVGDEVLVAVARRLAGAIRPYDMLARWGGEEFIVLVAGMTDVAVLRRIAEQLIETVRATPIETSHGPLRVSASAGAASHTAQRASPEEVIDAADQAMYAAKRRGRNRVVLTDEVTDRDTTPEEPEAIRLAEGLAIAASIREAVPPLHCAQVADLAAHTADALGLPGEIVLRCRLGGWLHDIGKLAVSDEILRRNATGTLTDAERETLHRHAEIGAAIIAGMPSLADAAAAVRHHHERFDGGGYPGGLRGEEIPLEARIVAAADAYSAITAGRAHQPALDRAGAITALQSAAGHSLDPTVVEAIASVLNAHSRAA
jgi:diguanylate cyclase (GGDEF)-like protein/PAS domain S-box-containing protein/putative nucleotidyltransferase with HDIG domain